MAVEKRILSRDGGNWLLCCWDDCEQFALETNKALFHDHPPNMRCDDLLAKHVWFAFCTNRHLMFHTHSHRSMGNLPSGFRLAIV
jgi:hypothetical protein